MIATMITSTGSWTSWRDSIRSTLEAGGNVVIPTFAIERAQELMYYLSRLVHDDRIPDVRIFLDSPMAVDVTEVFRRFRECFDQQTWELINSNESPLRFPGLELVKGRTESRAINKLKEPCVIMSTSGMCTAGRIKHHLRQNISRPESTILFVGYQARGTLGGQIAGGAEEVRIHGRQLPVRARVEKIYGFSGHADRGALLKWISHLNEPPRRVFLTHGDLPAAESLAAEIERQLGCSVTIPTYTESAELPFA